MPATYYTPVTLPHIDIQADAETETVTITGKRGVMIFQSGKIIQFTGLSTVYLIDKVFPNGAILIDSDSSVPRFHSWKSLFSGNNIFNDAISNTGFFRIW